PRARRGGAARRRRGRGAHDRRTAPPVAPTGQRRSRSQLRIGRVLVGGSVAAVSVRLSYVVGRLDRVLRRRLGEALAPHGLTVADYTALSVLRSRSGLSNAQLARRTLITPQSMNEVLGRLVERGYVDRSQDTDHGRIIRAEL